jgi:NAD(P)-dependent dehydrogenase (short-subunit alcohol dehydrogenase family)
MIDLSLFSLEGKKALVTGGAMGLGRACAHALAMAGADVAIVDLNEEIGNGTAAAIRDTGRNAVFIQGDVSKAEQIQSMIEAVLKNLGRLDIAVNNAGIYRSGDDEIQLKEDWDRVIGVNLTGTWLCAREEMRQMIKQTPTEGKIINIASIAASIACSNGSYDASKAGAVHLTRTLGARWGRYNINVNSISPGYVVSALGTSRSPEECQRIRQFTPLGYVQRPQDLFGAVVFLASRASDYITGQNLVVDGGHTLSSWMSPLERSVPPRVGPEMEAVDFERAAISIGSAGASSAVDRPGDAR